MNKLALVESTKQATLDHVLRRAGLVHKIARAFTDWPTLEHVASQFINYISPWLIINNENLAECRLAGAVAAYNRFDSEIGHRAFIEHLAHTAIDLVAHRVSVRDNDGAWVVWGYDEPLPDFMRRHQCWAIQVRARETPLPAAPVMIKLLAAVSTTRDLTASDINLAQLLNSEAQST